MPHQLLLHADWCAGGIQPSTVGVPEGMPSDSVPETRLHPSGPNVVLLDRTGVIAATCDWTRKYPIPFGEGTLGFPAKQDCGKGGIQREFVFRVVGLESLDTPVYDRLLYNHCEALEVDPRPAKRQDLADPQPGALSDDHHRSIRFVEQLYPSKKLFESENAGTPLALADSPDLDEFHWVAMKWHGLPGHGS